MTVRSPQTIRSDRPPQPATLGAQPGLVLRCARHRGALLAAPFFVYPDLPDEACCASRCSPAPSTCCSAMSACCPSAMPPSSAAPPTSPPTPSRSGAWSRELGILLGAAGAAVLGLIIGFFAIRRQGIYFAMITLALVADVLLLLPAGAVHPRRGRHPGRAARPPARHSSTSNSRSTMYYVVAGDLPVRLLRHLAHHQFALRQDPEGDPRERAARRSRSAIRVDRYKLGAFVMSAALAGLAGGTKAIVFQFATLTDVALADVGRGHPDDAARRHRHADRPGGRRRLVDRAAELSRRVGIPGHDADRHHLHGLRAAVPPRHRRRGDRAFEEAEVRAVTPQRTE